MSDEEEMEAGKNKKEQIEALRAAGAQPTILTEEHVRNLLEHSMPAPWVVYCEEGPVRLPSGGSSQRVDAQHLRRPKTRSACVHWHGVHVGREGARVRRMADGGGS